MNGILNHATTALGVAAAPSWIGKAVFIAVFALLIVLLLSLPPHLAGTADGTQPAWRRVRLWAVVVVLVQIAIYAWWG